MRSCILCLDAAQFWEHNVQFWHFYFWGGDPSMTSKRSSIITQTQREGRGIYDYFLGRSQAGRVEYKYTTCEARENGRGTENLLLDPPGL